MRVRGLPIVIRCLLVVLACGVVSQEARADLEQLTKDLLLLREKYQLADGPRKTELADALRQRIRERSLQLKAAITDDPALVLEVALPKEAREAMPLELQRDLERQVEVEGVIERAAGSSSRFPYQLRDRQGHVFHLQPVGAAPPFVEGATVRVSGIQLDDTMVFEGGTHGGLSGVSRSGRDTEAPVVNLTAPHRGDVVSGAVRIVVEASDNQRVAQVSVFKDGVQLASRDTAPYEVNWDTRREADGPHTLSAKAHDPDLNVGVSPSVIVTVDNTPPRVKLNSPLNRAAVSGTVTIEAQASDAIGVEMVKFLVDGLVVGIAVSPPYTYAWDTTASSNGPHTIEAMAVDRANNSTTSGAVEVRALNQNRAPILSPIGPKTVNEGVTLAFTVNATDPDGEKDPLTFRAFNLPPWATFDPVTRQFRGTPDFSEASYDRLTRVYNKVRFEVCDAQPLCDSEEIAISVLNVDRPPVINAIRNRTVHEGETVTITPIIMDPDGDPLTCVAERLPAWLHLNAATCLLSGTPDGQIASQQHPGTLYPDILLKACDPEQQCAQTTFTINVVETHQRPHLDRIGDQKIDEGKLLRLTVHAIQPDTHSLIVKATPLPEGATFFDDGEGWGTFAWTPREDQAGTYDITFSASDGLLGDAETVAITVREVSLAISGTVQDEFNKPFPGAQLEIRRPGDRKYDATTDDHGRYLVADLPPGSYTVRPVPNISSGNLPSATGVHFTPLSRSVELTTADQHDVNFTVLEKTAR